MMPTLTVSRITAQETHPLRLMVLRPGGTLADCMWPIDHVPEAIHLGVNDGNERICVVSLQPAGHPAVEAHAPWQLRGMATHPDHRGKGAGRLIVEHALDLLRALGTDVLWCNARLGAVPFYQRMGFHIAGPEFEIAGIGPHHLMARAV